MLKKSKASGSFLKKRTKKLLFTAGVGTTVATTRRTKSFLLLFFQKKQGLLRIQRLLQIGQNIIDMLDPDR